MNDIVYINMFSGGSTGNITFSLANSAENNGFNTSVITLNQYGHNHQKPKQKNHFIFGSAFESNLHYFLGRIFGFNGCYSVFSTLKLINRIKKIDPKIVHLHNLHGFCINVPLLFRFLKKSKIKVLWTMHDCWAITGHCAHFDMIGCMKWKTGCYNCPLLHTYPKSLFDDSKFMWKKKKKLFSTMDNLQIITPSVWLEKQMKESYLKNLSIRTIHNGIDLSKFNPINSDFRKRYNCKNEFLILGVANCWDRKKGIDVMISLAERLDRNFKIILVGTDSNVDKILPNSIISIHHTESIKELTEVYSAVDLFINPTREDTFPTVNIEALACGTPVLTFNTGGSTEIIDNTCGFCVEKDDIDGLCSQIIKIYDNKENLSENCVNRAKLFKKEKMIESYIRLYKEGI